ncbi:DUF6252 family protein [uncultured Acetobacteroides sp.]|uniref:DUF6252 family protein n=1 Tax=uncultured Acetobacteroides sp. TaxID=1760811 RepID=UPI0029F4B397|nr:DUF6252 family protein [uncultured Acetobacteroides sp.]
MRKLILAAVVACAALFTTSCDKDNDGNIIIPAISATIDGQEWMGLAPKGLLTSGVLTIASTSLDGKAIDITVKGDKEGTYKLEIGYAQCLALYKPSLLTTTEASLASTTGKVVITKFDTTKKRVSGTFEFTLVNTSLTATAQITKGTFTDVSYTTVQ